MIPLIPIPEQPRDDLPCSEFRSVYLETLPSPNLKAMIEAAYRCEVPLGIDRYPGYAVVYRDRLCIVRIMLRRNSDMKFLFAEVSIPRNDLDNPDKGKYSQWLTTWKREIEQNLIPFSNI